MSPEAQRIAIAEACGWNGPFWSCYNPATGTQCLATWTDFLRNPKYVPDYLSDLNAMHEAEKTLSRADGSDPEAGNQLNRYVWNLFEVKTGAPIERHVNDEPCDVIDATAAQRAEAFLKTIGKWTE